MKTRIITLLAFLTLSIANHQIINQQDAHARNHFNQGRQRTQHIYQGIQNIQRQLHLLQNQFIQGQQQLQQAQFAQPRNWQEQQYLMMQVSQLRMRLNQINQQGQHLMYQMQQLVMEARGFMNGSRGSQIGSIYESINLATQNNAEINRYVNLGGQVLGLLDEVGVF
jgi:predicted  nucleic acid-binding Zn-ribbon protein